MILKRIAPVSLARISGLLYAVVGFFVGCFFAMFSLLGSAVSEDMGSKAFGALFGAGAIIFLPILYGALGFIASLIGAAIYNLLAGVVGGIEVELVPKSPAASPAPGVVPTPHA